MKSLSNRVKISVVDNDTVKNYYIITDKVILYHTAGLIISEYSNVMEIMQYVHVYISREKVLNTK